MTTTTHNAADATQAADLDAAHVAWSQFPTATRTTFGTFAVNYLRNLHGAPPTFAELRALFPELPPSPFVDQALAMGVESVADLLAALAERDLTWTPGVRGECGTLHEGQPEPPDLHVVFDCFRTAWQRADDRADESRDAAQRWYGPNGAARSWDALRRDLGPLTPRGGIAPTTPRDEQ